MSSTSNKAVYLDTDSSLFEKIKTTIYEDSNAASLYVANQISDLIKLKTSRGEKIILGLATGSSPVKLYNYLVKFHKEDGLSFKNVITFNLDEYFPMEPNSIHSYVRFMNEHLFDHIDIKKENINIPDGTITVEESKLFNENYEKKIIELGGIDIQILGIGRTGHVGFNELMPAGLYLI